MTRTRSHARPICGERQARRAALLGAASLFAFGFFAGSVHATEIELVRPAVEPPPVSATIAVGAVDTRIGFDSFPAHLLSVHAPPAQRSPAAARPIGAEAQAAPLADARTLTGVFGLPELSPLEMEQPMRFYENDVLVKFRAPGGRSSFATVELIF